MACRMLEAPKSPKGRIGTAREYYWRLGVGRVVFGEGYILGLRKSFLALFFASSSAAQGHLGTLPLQHELSAPGPTNRAVLLPPNSRSLELQPTSCAFLCGTPNVKRSVSGHVA